MSKQVDGEYRRPLPKACRGRQGGGFEWEKCQKRNFLAVQGEFGKIISVVRRKMCFLIAYNGKSYVQ